MTLGCRIESRVLGLQRGRVPPNAAVRDPVGLSRDRISLSRHRAAPAASIAAERDQSHSQKTRLPPVTACQAVGVTRVSSARQPTGVRGCAGAAETLFVGLSPAVVRDLRDDCRAATLWASDVPYHGRYRRPRALGRALPLIEDARGAGKPGSWDRRVGCHARTSPNSAEPD